MPKVFTRIHLKYAVAGRGLDRRQVERAVKLSKDKYCSATQMLGKTAEITYEIAIIDGDRVPPPARRSRRRCGMRGAGRPSVRRRATPGSGSTSPSARRLAPARARRTGRRARSPAARRRCARASARQSARSLRIQSTAKPKSNLSATIVLPRLSICHDCAAPLPMTSSTALDVEAGLLGEGDALGERLDEPGDADLVDHLRELAAARAAHQRHRARVVGEHGLGARERRRRRRRP